MQQSNSDNPISRPKRKATNHHIFRYLQTKNPTRLEEYDLKRALEASLEDCPDFWAPACALTSEDSASCSSSSLHSNGTSSSNSSNAGGSNHCNKNLLRNNHSKSTSNGKRQKHSQRHLPNNSSSSSTANNLSPNSTIHSRYKPVARKDIYNEADFFHDGIMQFIEYELSLARVRKRNGSLDDYEDANNVC